MMKTPDTHETLLALSAQLKNGLEKGLATPNGKVIESINKLAANYQQVSKALCGKENATLDEVLQAVSQVKAELETVKRERDAAVKDMEWMMLVLCHNGCFICKNRHTDKCFWERQHRCEAKWRGVCPENTEVQE
jgi:hypothetical protein